MRDLVVVVVMLVGVAVVQSAQEKGWGHCTNIAENAVNTWWPPMRG